MASFLQMSFLATCKKLDCIENCSHNNKSRDEQELGLPSLHMAVVVTDKNHAQE